MPETHPPAVTPVRARAATGGTRWTATRWAIVIFVAAVAFVRLPSFVHQLYDPDEAAIAVQGMGIADGGTLYRDVIDRKPPLAPALYAAVFKATGTHDLRPMHAVVAIELVGAAALIAWDLRRRAGPDVALWGGLLLIGGALAFVPRDAQAANFSHLALLPGVAAIVLARRDDARAAGLAGVMVGLATLTRQTWLIGLAPAAVAAWWHGGRRWWRPALTVATTFLTIAAVGLFVPFGPFIHWTFTGNGSVLFDLSRPGHTFAAAWASIGLFVVGHIALLALDLVRGWDRDDIDLWLWLLTGLASVAAGARFFGHYWLQVLPALVLLGAPAVRRWGRWWRVALGGLLATTAVVFFVMACLAYRIDRTVDSRPYVQVVRANSHAGQKIAVWGSFPEIYWKSNRLPAGGLVISDFLVGKSAGRPNGPNTLREATPGATDDYLRALRKHPPQLFVDTAAGHIRNYGPYPISVIPELASFVYSHYHLLTTVNGVKIYELNR